MAYQEQLPETQQIQNISREMSQYQQNTYGQEIQKIQQFEVQAAPKIAKYNYSRYLFDRQQQQAVGQPIQGQPVQAQQINLTQQQAFDNAQAAAIKKANEEFKERVYPRPVQSVQQDPIVDPKREPKPSGPRKLTPIKLERSPIQPIVDPKREPFKPPKAIKPIIPKPIQPTVDPKKEPFKPPKAIKPKGLGNRPKNPNVPSAFQGINTNINKQRQDMR